MTGNVPKTFQDQIDAENDRKAYLWNALRSQVLTVDELKEVAAFGHNILLQLQPHGDNCASGTLPFTTQEALSRFHSALLIQQLLQAQLTRNDQKPPK